MSAWWVSANGKVMQHDSYDAALSDLFCCATRLGISADRLALYDRNPALHPGAVNLLPAKMAEYERGRRRR